MTPPSLTQSLLQPTLAILAVQEGARPWSSWAAFTAIALAGSALYGASLAAALHLHASLGAALWLTLSAGAGWFAFGPAMILAARAPSWPCAHACMVAMVWGEVALVIAAVANLALLPEPAVLPFNLAWVALTNLLMAALVAAQLRALHVPPWKTLLAWCLGLCGGGAAAAWLLAPLLLTSP